MTPADIRTEALDLLNDALISETVEEAQRKVRAAIPLIKAAIDEENRS